MNQDASQTPFAYEHGRKLEPLNYHFELVAYLKQEEAHVWDWANSTPTRAQQSDDMRAAMLRETYRLEPDGHPNVFAACYMAMDRLGIDAPVTLYQAADGAMNAALYYIPGEVHLVFSGPTLERLSNDELLALLGHELAHYRLWSMEEGAYYCANRVLDLAMSSRDATPSHRETARLMSLHTELFADRGAALVVGDIAPAVAMLVKVMTGLTTVDPAAYLRQAYELEGSNHKSAGYSHPESFLRARALEKWWQGDADLDEWLECRLLGPLSLEALDLLRQRELTELTRGFFARLTGADGLCSEEILTQVRRYFPKFGTDETPLDLDRITGDKIDDSTRNYLIALMFDCSMADPDLRDEVLVQAAKTATAIGADELMKTALKRDLKWTKKAADSLFVTAARAA